MTICVPFCHLDYKKLFFSHQDYKADGVCRLLWLQGKNNLCPFFTVVFHFCAILHLSKVGCFFAMYLQRVLHKNVF